MPWAVKPRPISAAAVMMAPLSARMLGPPRAGHGHGPARLAPLGLEVERPGAAGKDQQDARQDHQDAAAAAARPGAVGPLGVVKAPAAEQRPVSLAHVSNSRMKVRFSGQRAMRPSS